MLVMYKGILILFWHLRYINTSGIRKRFIYSETQSQKHGCLPTICPKNLELF